MKVLGINGSPHKNGNTVKLINQVFKGFIANGHECSLVHLIDLELKYCDWCLSCNETGICNKSDGLMNHIYEIENAAYIVIGCPVSTHTVTGYIKNWLDRVCNSQLEFKVNSKNEVTKKSRISRGKKSIIILNGCTEIMEHAFDPIEVVMNNLKIEIVETMIIKRVGLTFEDTIENRKEEMEKAYKIGKSI